MALNSSTVSKHSLEANEISLHPIVQQAVPSVDRRQVTDAREPPLPIDIYPGLERLLAPVEELAQGDPGAAVIARHRLLASEQRDASWSDRVETAVRRYASSSFASIGVDSERFDIAVLECRTSGCEMQAAGRVEDNARPATDPQFFLQAMIRGPLAAELDIRDFMITMTSLPDGRLGYIAYLSRQRPPIH